MSDIGLKGVGGFVVIGATALGPALITLVAVVIGVAVSSDRGLPVGRNVARFISGPVSATAAATAAFAWSWDGPSDAVDRFALPLAAGRLVVGVVAGFLFWRSSRRDEPPLSPG